MIVVVCLAFFLNFGFSKSLTANLKKLFEATEKIVDGKFDVKLDVKSSDEIGALAQAFNSMSVGLKEREKIKDAFDKFHSKEVAKKLLSGEIKLGGEKKQATVFFSDIRGFTAMSEKMTPDQVVTLLNEYFTAMVKIVYQNKGIVDKYIGDAILAVWGVPESSGNDAYNAVKASLQMRDHLRKWNEQRVKKGLFEMKIGIGLHTGEVLSGNIGAYERKLEYTVIGDTVNQASRIEGACKAVSSDLLISDATWAVVSAKGIECGPPIELKAKGKTHALVVHQVIGWKDAEGNLQTSLTSEEIETIKQGFKPVEEVEEAKTTVLSREKVQERPASIEPPGVPSENLKVTEQLMSNQHDVNKVEWYVVHDPGSKEYQGPFSLNQILAKLSDGQLTYGSAYVFRQGDSQMTPVTQLSQLDRRVKNPFANIQLPETVQPETVVRAQATTEEWYVAGPDSKTLGPYTEDELRVALGKGHMTRTTFVWKKGMDKWIHLHEIPNFDRRAS
jgi:class 3 adenylate cyclase